VGTDYCHKNLEYLIKIYKQLLIKHGINEKMVLVCRHINAGGMLNILKHIISSDNLLRDRVLIINGADYDTIIKLYKSSKLVLFFSLCEGFGLPVIESFAAKVPILISSLASLPEVAADAGVYIDFSNEQNTIGEIMSMLRDQSRRQEIINRQYERVSRFSWDDAARNTLLFYNCIMEKRKGAISGVDKKRFSEKEYAFSLAMEYIRKEGLLSAIKQSGSGFKQLFKDSNRYDGID